MNELRTTEATAIRPPVMYPDGRAECRTCRAHVRVGARVGSMAAAWCSVCCSTSVYDAPPARAAT